MPQNRVPAAALLLAALSLPSLAGPLTPPAGPVAPTPGPEPRIPISAATTPGDADSLFRISQPGSYYLTGNITGQSGLSGVEIAASGVTLDLNGFALIGVPGSISGVRVNGSQTAVAVRGGSAQSWDQRGFDLVSALSATAEDLAAVGNGTIGIACGPGAAVSRCTARGNTLAGISVANGSSLSYCAAASNTGDGILAGNGSSVVGCASSANGGNGIECGFLSVVTDCSATANAGDGVQARSSCVISNNTCSENSGDGIEVEFHCVVTGNTCSFGGNGAGDGAGILVRFSDNRIEGNNCTVGDRGIDVNASGNIIIRNTCSGNAVNYEIAAGNRYGTVVDITAGGTPAVSGNAAAGTLTSTDPNANFAY